MVLKLKSGDDLTLLFTVTDDDDVAINLTGGTLKLKIARNINVTNANAIYYGSFTIFTSPVSGIHQEIIPDSISSLWAPGSYQYQCRFIDYTGLVRSEDVGTIIIEQNLLDDETV